MSDEEKQVTTTEEPAPEGDGAAKAERKKPGVKKVEKKEKPAKDAFIFITGAFKIEFDTKEQMNAFWEEYRSLDHTIGKGNADAWIDRIAAKYGGKVVEHSVKGGRSR